MKYLIVGLGNIGVEYLHTRHNIGFDVLDALAKSQAAIFSPDRLADLATSKWKGRTLLMVKPTTFVNLSGKAVKYWMDKEKVPLENVLVVVDDLALPLEVLRLRPGGNDAGHNGLKSIQETLGTIGYAKLRFGIGNHFPKGGQVDFVLGTWTSEEQPVVEKKIHKSVEIIESFVTQGIQRTMNQFNRWTA
ncbi:MAG: aminoacyl-tRNA hydrolase [Chitinophagaceae bacterium]